MKIILRKDINALYKQPNKTVKGLKAKSWADIVLPLILGSFMVALAIEMRSLQNGIYEGLNAGQGAVFLIGNLLIGMGSFIVALFAVPLLIYWLVMIVARVKAKAMNRLVYVLALLAPLYGLGTLFRVLLDVVLPDLEIFHFFELLILGSVVVYIMSILILAVKEHFKLKDVLAGVIGLAPWMLIFLYNLI